MKPAIFALPFLLLPFAPAPPSPPRDIIPPDMHGVHFVLSVDASAISSCRCRAYEIAQGDTIVEIAKRECGDARCADEIRLMNPQVKDDKLGARDRLKIPPRASAADSRATTRATGDASGCWVLATLQWWMPGKVSASIIVEGEPIEVERRSQVRVVVVPREKLLWFLQKDWDAVDPAKPIDGVTSSDIINPTRVLPKEDPVVRIEDRVTLKNGKDHGIVFDVERRRYDKDGKILAWTSVAGRLFVASLPVAAIGLLALVGIVGLARRRRARAEP